MKISYGHWHYALRLRLLPSIEFSNFNCAELERHYGYKYEVQFRWLHFWLDIKFVRV